MQAQDSAVRDEKFSTFSPLLRHNPKGDGMKTTACTLLLALSAMTALAADVTGKWSGTFAPEGQNPSGAYVVLKQSGETLTGSAGPEETQQWPIANGKIQGNKITGTVTSPEGMVFKLDLTVDGDRIKGDVTGTQEGQVMKGKVDLARVKS
jgi:hypothetical protein